MAQTAKKSERKSAKKRGDAAQKEPLSRKDYEKQLKKPHIELVKLQEWLKHKGLKVCVVFEGRDGASKGGTIKAIPERVSPRVFKLSSNRPTRSSRPTVPTTRPALNTFAPITLLLDMWTLCRTVATEHAAVARPRA